MSDATVYRVWPDLERFSRLLYDLPDDYVPVDPLAEAGYRDFFGESKLDRWRTPPVYVHDLTHPSPDIWYLISAGTFVFTETAIETLEPLLSMAGELLPLHNASSVVETEELFALNITNLVDCIDMARSDFQSLVIYPDFIKHRLGEPTLFIVPQLARRTFCVEWDDTEDSFKRRVEEHGLEGIGFERVWSSATGAENVNLMGI